MAVSLAGLSGVEDPITRWPQLAVDPTLPDQFAERRGQAVFIKNCMPCHRLNGAGAWRRGTRSRPTDERHRIHE